VEYDDGVLELIRYFDEDRSAEPLVVAHRPDALASSDAELPLIDEWAESEQEPAAAR